MSTTYEHLLYSGNKIQVDSAVRDGEGTNITNNYAKQTGYYQTLGSGEADIAYEIYSDRQIENPEVACPPITFGVAGGEAEIQSGLNKFEFLYGKSQVWNQLARAITTQTLGGSGTTRTVTDGVASVVATYQHGVAWLTVSLPVNHKVLLIGDVDVNNKTGVNVILSDNVASQTTARIAISQKSGWQTFMSIATISTAANAVRFGVQETKSSGWDTIKMRNFMTFDLTAMNYPMTGLTNDQIIANFKADYPLEYYDYNAGTILSVKSASLISRMKNQCSGLNEFIRVLPNTEYELSGITAGGYIEQYDANENLILTSTEITSTTDITLTANTYYVKIQATTYSNVMFYNTFADNGPGSGVYGEPYVPYEEDTVELPNIRLRSVGSGSSEVRDEAYQTGGGIRRVGYVDLGSLTWSYNSGYSGWTASISDYTAEYVAGNQKPVMACSKYICGNYQQAIPCIRSWVGLGEHAILLKDSATVPSTMTPAQVAAALTGVKLIYKLNASTEITTTENPGWREYVKVDNFGTLEFTNSDNQTPQVEQPYFIKYTINLVEFTDSAYVRTGGNANEIALLSDVEAADNEVIRKLEDGEVIPALSENFDTNMTIEQDTPYLFRTAGGSSEITTPCRVKEIEGASVVWNQLHNPTASTYGGVTYTVGSNGVVNFNATNSGYSNVEYLRIPVVKGHTYYFKYSITISQGASNIKLYGQLYNGTSAVSTWWQGANNRYTVSDTADNVRLYLTNVNSSGALSGSFVAQLFDLTQMFGPGHEPTAAQFKSLFPKDYYAYTATPYLLNVTTSGKKYVGFNAYNNETGTAQLVGGNEYQVTGTYTALSFTDINSVTSTPTLDENNCFTPTFDGTLTITGGNATDTCVNLYWDGEREGDFEAYTEHTYPTDSSVELRGNLSFDSQTGNVVYDGDTYGPDGTITRKYAVGPVSGIRQWSQVLSNGTFADSTGWTASNGTLTIDNNTGIFLASQQNAYLSKTVSSVANNHKYLAIATLKLTTGTTSVSLGFGGTTVNATNTTSKQTLRVFYTATSSGNKYFAIQDRRSSGFDNIEVSNCMVLDLTAIFGAGNEPTTVAQFTALFPNTYYAYKTATANTDGALKFNYLTADYTNYLYKLITPTTEETQATAYSEVQVVDNWGTEEWLTSGDAVLPVGNDTIYLPDLKAKLEAAPEAPDNEGYYVVLRDGNENKYVLADSLLATQEEIDEILALLQ